ncbi:membrane-spanning 4-domains subfamily A member 6C-like [Symphorus nematophorus]
MSVTMTRAEGVTVFTLTSDPQSACPPICQIFKGLCYSPACCSVSQHLRRIQTPSLSVLGALHIMVGLLNIGLGAILCCSGGGSSWQMDEYGYPYWLGGMFILFGIMSIVSEKRSSPCLVILNVILNLAGVAFAIAAIVLYSINIGDMWMWGMCEDYYNDHAFDEYYSGDKRPTQSPQEQSMKDKCLEGRAVVEMFLKGINGLLIVLSVLELCLAISSAVMGMKALCSSEDKDDKNTEPEPELYKPLLEEVTSNPAV